jgi:iron complex transport system substrate-binding protein
MFGIRKIIIIIFVVALAGSPFPSESRIFKDSLGREVRLEKIPERIIPLAPSLTEILYYLGLGDRVAGVTEFSDYPAGAKEKPVIGSYIDLNIEKIITLSPDLVIGTKDGNKQGEVDLLEQASIPVFVVNPRDIRGVISTIAEIANLCGVGEKGNRAVDDLTKRLEAVTAAVEDMAKPLVFLQINLRPIMTVNKNTFHNDLINLGGGINMTLQEPITYPRISIEEVIRREPDVIIISSMDRGGEFEKAKEGWMKWSSIPAVKNNRVYLIDSDLIDRPSPRIVQGLEDMARLIHPEVNWDQEQAPKRWSNER